MNDDSNALARDLDDDGLVAELRRLAAEVDSVPDEVFRAARAAIATLDLDGELAVLVGDSAEDGDPAFAAVRAGSAGAARLLCFEASDVAVDLEVTRDGDRLDVLGQLTGTAPGGCVLEDAGGGRRRLDVDDLGRFLVSATVAGALRVRCRSAATGTRVTTAWVMA